MAGRPNQPAHLAAGAAGPGVHWQAEAQQAGCFCRLDGRLRRPQPQPGRLRPLNAGGWHALSAHRNAL